MQGGAALPKHGGKKRAGAGAEPTRPAGEGGTRGLASEFLKMLNMSG